MKSKKILAALAASVMLLSSTACQSGGDSSSNSTVTSGSTTAPVGTSVLNSDISADTAVASFEGHDDMNVTFGEFLKEYKYYLYQYSITDDTDPNYADMLQGQREYIVNYLINEKIAEKKFNEYGLSLSDEELAQIDADTKAGIENLKTNSLTPLVKYSLAEGETLSDEELAKKVEEKYQEMLSTCGISEEDFNSWQKAIVLQNKLTEYLNKDYVYDPSEAITQLETIVENAKQAYENDPSSYNPDNMSGVWIPEGSREIQQILIGFDSDSLAEIQVLRKEGKDTEADALVEEKLGGINDRIKEVEDKLAAGEDFSALMKEYSDDTDTSAVYIVTPGTKIYVSSFTECALAIPSVGENSTCVSDYGYHILNYKAEAVVTDEEYNAYLDSMHSYLENAHRSQNLSNATKEWREEYKFTIDRDALMLAEETTEAK